MLIAIVVLLALQVLFTLSLHAAITNLAGVMQRQATQQRGNIYRVSE